MGRRKKIKMKIGIDLDDVVFEFTREFIKFYNEKYGKEIKFEEVDTYDFPKVFDLSLQTTLDLIKEMISIGIARNLPFCDYAKEAILDLSKNHEIFFITSRVVRERTLENLKQLFSEIEFQLIFSSNSYAGSEGKSKAEICHEQGIDIMIEDDKGYAEDISKKGVKVLILDKPWNRECQEHENIARVGNWIEVREKIGNFENNIVEQVRQFVKEECKKPTSKYGEEPYLFHFVPVSKYAKILSKKLGADLEIVELSAWLHDIGSIIEGRENHHITGKEIAERKLRELNYPKEKIEQVKHCIFAHRGSKNIKRETIEAQIIADADVMAHFDNIGRIFKAAFVFENHTQQSAQEAVRDKLVNSYNKLSLEAKKIIKPKFEAAMLLFN